MAVTPTAPGSAIANAVDVSVPPAAEAVAVPMVASALTTWTPATEAERSTTTPRARVTRRGQGWNCRPQADRTRDGDAQDSY
ncbi:hypothetical protein ABGB07_18430 [Micromonosporaceae bacterium B7E4]